MGDIGYFAVGFFVIWLLYTYVGYPLALKLLAAVRRRPAAPALDEWPSISITVPMYNEEAQAQGLIESLLALDYPKDRLQVLIVSDGSTDRTNEIVEGYLDQGIEFIRQPQRSGKTACENAAADRLTGDIILNTDASIRIRPEAVKRLIAAFGDPAVGLASGRDVSVSAMDDAANVGESGYVGYEMWIRDLETAVHGIVGASGCFYAIRADLHRIPVPGSLSRDFSAALKCEQHGFRAVSVPDAICLVPRTSSLRAEYPRKVRTITRGMETLHHWRQLLNPFGHGLFAWMLLSHKIFRWGLPWVAVAALFGLFLIGVDSPWAMAIGAGGILGTLVGLIAWRIGDAVRLPGVVQLAGYAVVGNLAAMHASIRALRGDREAIWEPTRRGGSVSAT